MDILQNVPWWYSLIHLVMAVLGVAFVLEWGSDITNDTVEQKEKPKHPIWIIIENAIMWVCSFVFLMLIFSIPYPFAIMFVFRRVFLWWRIRMAEYKDFYNIQD